MTRQKVGEFAGVAIYADQMVPPDMVYIEPAGFIVASLAVWNAHAAQRDPSFLVQQWRENSGASA